MMFMCVVFIVKFWSESGSDLKLISDDSDSFPQIHGLLLLDYYYIIRETFKLYAYRCSATHVYVF